MFPGADRFERNGKAYKEERLRDQMLEQKVRVIPKRQISKRRQFGI